MNRRNKTIAVAVYPNGTRYTIRKQGGVYWWKWDSGSYPFAAAVENVEAEGGKVVREPNPNYREPTPFDALARFFG